MNLIEQLGGYEAAKAKLRDNGSLHAERLKAALLEYRRQHNMFEKGDRVIYLILGNSVVTYDDWLETQNSDWIRHATLDEIRAGHRIDANTDYVTDIRNHISPMTIVQGD